MDLTWLKQLAPTVATALGGPLAGLAVEAVSKALGVPQDDVKGVLDSAKLTSEQLGQIKLAELDLKKQAEALNLDFEKLATADRANAREMQVANKSMVPATLAVVVTVGFFGILTALMLGYATKSEELLVMLGSLGTAWTGIIAFYFGSSSSSQRKDAMLYNSAPIK